MTGCAPTRFLPWAACRWRLIEGERAARIVQVVEDQLWTPMGPRSLAPGEKDYAPHYSGTAVRARRRLSSGHGLAVAGRAVRRGLGARAWRHTRKPRQKPANYFLTPQLSRLDLPGLHHVPEIADAEPPHTARGCPFQAWSLGEILRLEHSVL